MDYISLGVLLLVSAHYSGEYFYTQWFLGSAVTAFCAASFISKKSSIILGAYVAYICVYTAYICYFTKGHYALLSPSDRVNYISAALMTNVSLLFITSLLFIRKTFLKSLSDALPYYGVLNSVVVCVSWFIGVTPVGNSGYSGFIQNPSINASLIAYSMVYTICTKANLKHKAILLIPCLCAIFLSKSSIAYGVLATGVTTYWLSEKWVGFSGKINKKAFIVAPLIFLAVLIIGYAPEGDKLFHSSDRLDAYSAFLSYWWINYDNLFGSGPGSFFILSQNISKAMSLLPERGGIWYWPWMHSDPLQELFQTGWFGFSLIVLAFLDLSIRLFVKRKSAHLALFFTVCASGIFNYPARHFPTAFVGAIIIASSYRALIEE